MRKDKDLLKVWLDFSVASRQEGKTAEENLMRLLMQEIQELLEDADGQEPRRIWTLHKVVGNQIYFYKSNSFQRSANHRNLIISTAEGLIGEAIRRDEGFLVFENADEETNYIKGWDDCKAELISLVRDSRNNIIGVINIESNIASDFSWSHNTSYDSEQKKYLIRQLKQIVDIASNYISLIFRNHLLVEGEKSSINLIKAISEYSPITRAILQETMGNLARWLNDRGKLLKVILYLTEPNDISTYKRLSKIDLVRDSDIDNQESEIDGIKSEISHTERMRFLFNQGSRKFSRAAIADIFGTEFAASLLIGSEDPSIHFLASEVLDENNNYKTLARYFVGIVLAESNISNFEVIRTFFEVIKNTANQYFKYKINKLNSISNRATIEIYRTILQEDTLRIALNKIATHIADETEARFCMIYLVAIEEAYHSRHKFYLGGAGKGTVDFADIRFAQNKSIVSHVLQSQEKFYHEDFYSCKENKHLLDRHLKEQGLEKPEIYAFPLSMQNFGDNLNIGVIVLIRENSDAISETNRPNPNLVRFRLSGWTEDLSSIIYKTHKQADFILSETFKVLAETLSDVIRQNNTKRRLFQLQVKVTQNVLPLWREIVNPARFVIYTKTEEQIEIVDQEVLPKFSFDPPKFTQGKGLTGSVISNGEVYEPFVEDFEIFAEGSDESTDKMRLVPTPDRHCKLFWDGILGDKRRMYYGRHVVLNDTDYILLIVGVRQNRFLPSLGYKLVHDFTDVVVKCLKELVDLHSN